MLDNRTEGIRIVKAIALFEPFGNKARLITLNGPICMFLHFEHPLGVNRLIPGRGGTKVHVPL
jgi:hypothetical protein